MTSGEILETAGDVAAGALQAGADIISRSPPRSSPGPTTASKPNGGADGTSREMASPNP